MTKGQRRSIFGMLVKYNIFLCLRVLSSPYFNIMSFIKAKVFSIIIAFIINVALADIALIRSKIW